MSEFFKCLICNKYFESSWKIQQHIQKHDADGEMDRSGGRRRGMLPIEKVTFVNCCVRLVRVDPDDIPNLKDSINFKSNSTRSTRKCRVEANIKLKQIAKVLNNLEDKKNDSKRRMSTSSSSSSDVDLHSDEEDEIEAKKSTSTSKKKKIFKLKCSHCSDTFPNRHKLSLHIFQSHKDAAADFIPCPLPHCTFHIMDYDVLQYHLTCHRTAEQKEIIFKTKESQRLNNLLSKCGPAHFLKVKGFTCKYCLKSETSLDSLNSHFKSHADISLQCQFCKESDSDFEGSVLKFICHLNSTHPNQLVPEEERKKRNRKLKLSKSKAKKSPPPKDDTDDIKRPYPCPICFKRFSRKEGLRRHAHLHLENNPFVCHVASCRRKFNSSYNLRRHLLLHGQENGLNSERFECSICKRKYTRSDHLRRHLIGHRSQATQKKRKARVNFMQSEGFVFPRASNFQSTPQPRRKIIKAETVEEIELIDNIIINEDGEAIHLKGEELTPARPVNVSHPTDEYITEDKIMMDSVFKNIAEVDSKAVEGMKVRKYYRIRQETFKCTECNVEFLRAHGLQAHMKTVHNKKSLTGIKEETEGTLTITLICSVCAYPAKNHEDFQEHLKSSDACRIFKCPQKGCKSRHFGSKEELDSHINRVHKSERSHICNVCEKAFTSNLDLVRHKQRVHKYDRGVKKTCPICGNKLAPVSFHGHMKRHNKVNPNEFQCKICNDILSCPNSLRRHIRRVHLGKTMEPLRATKVAVGSKETSKGSIGQRDTASEAKMVVQCKIDESTKDKPVDQSESNDEMEILGF